MNYEEKYKQALERARQFSEHPLQEDSANIVEYIFPELAESEDEKIRKALIEMIHDTTGDECEDCYHVSKESVLAWLEKQGEQKPNPYSGTSFEYNGNIWGMCARDNGVEILFDGELKAFLSLEKSFIYPIYPKPDLAHKSAIEAIKENVGNNNKVEPKFHVGDWISGYYTNYKVLSVNNEGYVVEDTDGNKINILFENEKFHHLFTIVDAKDGDVLVTTSIRNCPFIYRKTDRNNNLAYFYAGIDGNGDFCEGCLKRTLCHFGSVANVAPATKEQRDLLFQKMKEAGYEWDAEKKELKKIEQKTLNADKVIAWLVCNIIDFEDYVKRFKQDFGL